MDTKDTTEGKGFFGALAKAAKWLDDRLRFFDLKSNRTKDGLLEGLLGNSRHSHECLILPALLSAVLVLGVPQVGMRLFLALAVTIGVYGLVTWLTRHSIRRGWSVRADLLLQVAVVLAVAGAAWLLGGNTYPDGGGVYRYFFVVFVPITGLAMVIAGFLSPMIWSNARHNSNHRNTLDKTELFCRREQGLPVVVDEPTTRLEVAAALNANFPPVFSNAAVDVGGKARYWITDGGTVDNRGIEMLLYALRDVLGDANGRARCGTLPKITVVVADASAFSNAYSQNRGVGTVTAAGTQFASQLVAEQLRSIRAMYEKDGHPDYFRFVYLPMPLRLRESGSFGTHWMLQPHIEVQSGGGDSRPRWLSGEETLQLLRELHGAGQGSKLSADGQTVLGWVRQDKAWNRAARKLDLVP